MCSHEHLEMTSRGYRCFDCHLLIDRKFAERKLKLQRERDSLMAFEYAAIERQMPMEVAMPKKGRDRVDKRNPEHADYWKRSAPAPPKADRVFADQVFKELADSADEADAMRKSLERLRAQTIEAHKQRQERQMRGQSLHASLLDEGSAEYIERIDRDNRERDRASRVIYPVTEAFGRVYADQGVRTLVHDLRSYEIELSMDCDFCGLWFSQVVKVPRAHAAGLLMVASEYTYEFGCCSIACWNDAVRRDREADDYVHRSLGVDR